MVSDAGAPAKFGGRIKRVRYPAAIALALLLAGFIASPFAAHLHRLSADFLLPYAAKIAAADRTPGTAPVALIVIDETTHQTPPFSETPEIAWTPFLASIIDATADAGAKVIGLDIIYPKSISGRELMPGRKCFSDK